MALAPAMPRPANNETGSRQPVHAIADLAHAAGALMPVDAAQAVGKVAVDVEALGTDLLTLVGHKFYAPKGVEGLAQPQP
ncbi:MAG: aminotransferase class V-fold PLP-dependent enzyme [Thiobacillus sp.]|nr:aminotransferase class V-fold PLP-dependent enzyme [Thiobacillus sp.]